MRSSFEISSYSSEGIKMMHLEKQTFIRRNHMIDRQLIEKVIAAIAKELPEVFL